MHVATGGVETEDRCITLQNGEVDYHALGFADSMLSWCLDPIVANPIYFPILRPPACFPFSFIQRRSDHVDAANGLFCIFLSGAQARHNMVILWVMGWSMELDGVGEGSYKLDILHCAVLCCIALC